jgi:hypothetical protein
MVSVVVFSSVIGSVCWSGIKSGFILRKEKSELFFQAQQLCKPDSPRHHSALSVKLGPRLDGHRHGARDDGAPGCWPSWSFAFGGHGFCDALPIALNLNRLRSARCFR